jgi:7,8-dihydroneopterin aldolase/epimerase/oxygenase
MSVTIEVSGLEIFGRHGVEDDERRSGQRFLFDLWLDAPDAASGSDRIEDAVDYREVAATVRAVSDGHAFALLEALAAAVADALVARFRLERVRVRVRKPDVRLADPVDYTAVSVERVSSSG